MILAAAALAACVASPDWEKHPFRTELCPQVYRIHGDGRLDGALDLVFLPAGFAEEELDVFRCGVALTLDALLSRPPYDRHACAINAYRIDLASKPIPFPATCGGDACTPIPPVWTDGDRASQCAQLSPGIAVSDPAKTLGGCLELDLGVAACPGGSSSCRVMWPDVTGLRRIWRLAACAPAFDVVVVVANSGVWAGGGTDDLAPPLTVVTLNGVSAERTRARLLAHELGHALGLLDEYATAYPGTTDLPEFQPGRNVVRGDGAVPWQELCGATNCVQVPECGSTAPPTTPPAVGLYEGAFYQSCGFYRAASDCSMSDAEEPMCPACSLYVSRLLEDMGLERCAGK